MIFKEHPKEFIWFLISTLHWSSPCHSRQFSLNAVPSMTVSPRCQQYVCCDAVERLSYMYWMMSILVNGIYLGTLDNSVAVNVLIFSGITIKHRQLSK